jgi:hypothetical protein
MKKLEEILNSFTDTELAYLHKYQVSTYLPSTQEKVRDYIFRRRNLTPENLKILLEQKTNPVISDEKLRCPRCKSDKLRNESVNWSIPAFKAGAEDEYATLHEIYTGETYRKDMITCNVCALVVYDPNNEKRPFYKRITDYLLDNPLWSLFEK